MLEGSNSEPQSSCLSATKMKAIGKARGSADGFQRLKFQDLLILLTREALDPPCKDNFPSCCHIWGETHEDLLRRNFAWLEGRSSG